MGLNSTKSASDPVLSTDYNGLYTAVVGTDTEPTSPVLSEPWPNISRNTLYYYDSSTFSGPAAGWYKRNVGIVATGTAADSAVRIPKIESGQNLVPYQGTWGISSNKFYSVTDANLDMAATDSGTQNPTAQCLVSGTLNNASTYRIPTLVFRALDANNALWVYLNNGNINLLKRDAGVISSLASAATATADGTNYTMTVVCNADVITVYNDGTLLITHTLAAANYKYMEYTKVGILLQKNGAPATSARWSALRVNQAR